MLLGHAFLDAVEDVIDVCENLGVKVVLMKPLCIRAATISVGPFQIHSLFCPSFAKVKTDVSSVFRGCGRAQSQSLDLLVLGKDSKQ